MYSSVFRQIITSASIFCGKIQFSIYLPKNYCEILIGAIENICMTVIILLLKIGKMLIPLWNRAIEQIAYFTQFWSFTA